MIDELKAQIEKTFGQKITSRGLAEALSQDIYLKTNTLVSYNTIRRLFGLVAYTKPRQSTLDYLAKYCSFESGCSEREIIHRPQRRIYWNKS